MPGPETNKAASLHRALQTNGERSSERRFCTCIGYSCAAHLLAIMAIVLMNPLLTAHRTPKELSACEFVLQSTSEKTDNKAQKIALHSAKAHGKHDPNRHHNKTEVSQHKSLTARRTIIAKQDSAPAQQSPSAKPTARTTPHKHHLFHMHLPRIAARPRIPAGWMHRQFHKLAEVIPRVHPRRATPSHASMAAIASSSASSTLSPNNSSLNPDRDVDNRSASENTRASADFGPYMNYIHRQLERKWNPPDGPSARFVRVVFRIQRDGHLSSLRLARSSGNHSYDVAAISAVRMAAPFRQLPDGAPNFVDIDYTFDYTLYRHRG